MPNRTVTEAFLAKRDKLKTLDQLFGYFRDELPQYSITLNWSNHDPLFTIQVSGFVNPPSRYSLKGLYILADDLDEWLVRVKAQLPRLLEECVSIDRAIEADQLSAVQADVRTQAAEVERSTLVSRAAVKNNEGGVPHDAPLGAPKRIRHVKSAKDRKGTVKTRHTRRAR